MVLKVSAASVGASAATESAVAASASAATSVASPALIGAVPMGADLDSIQFAEALNAAGAAFIATSSEHCVSRGLFAGAQNVAAATYAATDVINNTALAL